MSQHRKYDQKVKANLMSVHREQARWYCNQRAIKLSRFHDGTIVIDHVGKLRHRSNISDKHYSQHEQHDINLGNLLVATSGEDPITDEY